MGYLLDKISAWYEFCKLKIKSNKDDKFQSYIQKLMGRQKVLKAREKATCNPLSWELQIVCSYSLI